jgi:hypothetical protein
VPTYTYTDDELRYYPTLGLTAVPGATHELDANPDPSRFVADDQDDDQPVPGAPFGPLPTASIPPKKKEK